MNWMTGWAAFWEEYWRRVAEGYTQPPEPPK